MAKKKTDHSELLEEILDRYDSASEAWEDQHATMLEDMEFEDGKQWRDEDINSREGRPSVVINKVSAMCKQIVGSVRQNKPSMKVRPVDSGADVKTADVLGGILRNIENTSDAETVYDTGFDCALRGGLGFWRAVTEYSTEDTFDQDIAIKRIVNPFTVLLDPAAEDLTFEDGRFGFIISNMMKDDFEEAYPDAAAEYQTNFTLYTNGEGSLSSWFTESSVQVAEYFYKKRTQRTILLLMDGTTIFEDQVDESKLSELEGLTKKSRKVEVDEVWWCLTNGAQILEEPRKWPGKYIPIIPCCGEEVWIGPDRTMRSVIKWAKDPQRLYNWARSTSIETLALAPKQPFMLTSEQIEGHEAQWQEHHRKPMPYLIYNHVDNQGAPQRQQSGAQDVGAFSESMAASEDIKSSMGIFDASLGAKSNETSGVAIIARQREGDNSTFTFVDNQTKAITYTAKVVLDLIPYIYDTERVVRLLNADGSEGWETINKESPDGTKMTDISIGKYDVVPDSGPGLLTRRIEAANSMAQLLQFAPATAPVIIPRLAKNLDWPEAQEIAEELKQVFAPQQPPQPTPEEKVDFDNKEATLEGKNLLNAKRAIDLAEEAGDRNELELINRQMAGEY